MQPDSLLLRAKLRKPPLIGEIVPRPGLLEGLDAACELPLVLVVAPAGYGKTTLLSEWLENRTKIYAWLSLDERYNNLFLFVSYFLAAIETLFPDAGKETSVMMDRLDSPPPELLAAVLISEIDEIKKDFILVLDDYHYIHDTAIHNLLSELFRHPPDHLHLFISTRRDPPLPLVKLRAQRYMSEIRTADLRLSLPEATEFMRKTMRLPLDDGTIAVLQEKTEGWIVALSLIALSLGHNPDTNRIQALLKEKDSPIINSLLDEVSSRIPSAIREFLLKISILNTFCAPLCDAILQDFGSDLPVFDSLQYLRWLEKENLLIFPVDEEHIWYRFHQLFQHFLNLQMKKAYSADEITRLHIQASRWLAQNRFFEEAIRHALLAGDTALSIHETAKYRHDLRSQEQWQSMECIVQLFSADIIKSTPDLLMAEAWIMYARFQMDNIPDMLDHIDTLLSRKDTETPEDQLMRGEIDALRSVQFYRTGDYQKARVHAEKSLKELSEDWFYARGVARTQLAGVYQVSGNLKDACTLLSNRIESYHYSTNPSAYLHEQTGLCYILWMAGDLPNLENTASNALAVAEKNNLELHTGTMHYFLGIAAYYQNNLAEAEHHLQDAFERCHAATTPCATGSGFGLALTYRAQGNYSRAIEVIVKLKEHILKSRNILIIPYIQMFQAELSLLSGKLNTAVKTAMDFPAPSSTMQELYYPHFTLVKMWLVQNTSHSLQQARELLAVLREFTESTHNNRFLMDILALEALLSARLGNEKSAPVLLNQALILAKKTGFIRNFVDIGPGIANLLQHLNTGEDPFVQQILEAFTMETPIKTVTASKLSNYHLTNQETKILELLAERLSNKEIAAQMVISPGTVKGHTIRIYQKLNARSRREAVEKAISLGIIASTMGNSHSMTI